MVQTNEVSVFVRVSFEQNSFKPEYWAESMFVLLYSFRCALVQVTYIILLEAILYNSTTIELVKYFFKSLLHSIIACLL